MREREGSGDVSAQEPRLWRHRDFRLLWCGQTISIFGDRVTELALPWLVLQSTGSPLAAGATFLSGQLPALLLGPLAGMAADRWERRRIMLICNLIACLGLLTLVVAAQVGHLTYLHILIVMFVLGTSSTGFLVAYGALLPDLVGRRALTAANAGLEAADAVSTVAGPALGGALLQVLGPALALGTDALSFAYSALTLASLRHGGKPAPPAEKRGPIWQEASAGMLMLVRLPAVRLTSLCSVGLNLFSGSIVLLLIDLTQRQLHLAAGPAGFVLAAAGVGGFLTSLIAGRLVRFSWGRVAAITLLVAAGACIWLSVAGSFWQAIVGNGILDGSIALAFIIVGSAGSAVTPDRLLGRVNAAHQMLYSLVRGGGPIVLGAILARWGVSLAFLCCAGLLVALALLAALAPGARVALQDCVPLEVGTNAVEQPG